MQGRGLRLAAALLLCAAGAGALPIERLDVQVRRPTGALERRSVEVVSGRALVRFDPDRSAAARAAAMSGVGGRVVSELGSTGWTLVQLPPGLPVSAGLGLLRGVSGALEVHPDHVYRPVLAPNDPSVSSQYHLSKVSAFAGWEFETGFSSRVTVAVIDVGIQGTNSELSGKLVGVSQFFDPNSGGAQSANNPPTPACNHATQVAGVAAATTNNGAGVAGISWGARLISLKVFADGDCNPVGNCPSGCTTSDTALINAINHAVTLHGDPTHGKIVINMSLGGLASCPAALQTAVTNASAAGLLLVAAAGNDGPGDNTVNNPGNCTGVVPVGATDINDAIASFSSRGAQLASSGLVAPGKSIVTTDLGGGTAAPDGTSFASPMVAGTAALIWSVKPTFTATQVRDTIRSSVDNIGVAGAIGPLGNSSGAGRLNVYNALRLAVNGTLSDFQGKQKAIAFPNPFRPSEHGVVTITIPDSVQGRNPKISIYTIDGIFVREVPGQTWDGKNAAGTPVASGVYLFVVKTDSGMQRGRVAVLR